MAGLISPTTLEQIRSANDIVDVIGGYLPLKRAGANWVTLCPFHKEKTPSFSVNPHRQIFYCFGCHQGGDVFGFLQKYENLTFIEAVRRLAEKARIPLETDEPSADQPSRRLKDTLLQIHEQLAQRWQAALQNDTAGEHARRYLKQRGITPEAVDLFRLGYAPDAWDDTVNWAKHKDYDLKTVEQAGLILRKERSDHFYDRFRGRLMFPIADEQGRVIGFSGRILQEEVKAAKYVNSPETPIFLKRKVFFGLDKSKRALLDQQCAVLCEGQLDLIACYMAGIKNVVAPQGTALTGDHARTLKRYVDEVVLCFDSDSAGQSATVRALDDLLASGLAIRVATVPPPHDPDSFLKENGAEAFQQLLAKAPSFFDFYLRHLIRTHDPRTDKGRLAVVRAMAEALHKTGNQVLVDTYSQKTALNLGVSPEAVRAEIKKGGRRQSRPVSSDQAGEESSDENQPAARPPPQEYWLMKLLLLDEIDMDWVFRHLDPQWVQNPVARQIVDLRLTAHARQSWSGVAGLLSELPDAHARNLATEAVSDPRPIPNPDEVLQGTHAHPGVVQRLRDLYLDRQMAALTHQAGAPDTAEEKMRQLLQEKEQLRRQKQSPITPRQPSIDFDTERPHRSGQTPAESPEPTEPEPPPDQPSSDAGNEPF